MKSQVSRLSQLIKMAQAAAKTGYAPYSKYKVGAALLGASGEIYTGANIENRSFGATICAERVALVRAVHSGERKFSALVIFSSGKSAPKPCGLCLQALSEFVKKLKVIVVHQSKVDEYDLNELYPNPF